MSSPDLTDDEARCVIDVIRSGHLSIGEKTRAFEASLAKYAGTEHAVAVSSGTAGLHLMVIAAGVRDGDIVATTPFSFVASANCILYERAIPLFVDVDKATGNIDTSLLAQAINDVTTRASGYKRWLPRAYRESQGVFKAILPVHAFGQPAKMTDIMKIGSTFGLPVLEDACEALGAECDGSRAGSIGVSGCFAFYPNKQMTTGEGGAVITNDEQTANLMRSLRNQGRDVFDAWLNHSRLGFNYRPTDLTSAIGLVQLRRLDVMLAKRAQVAAWYTQRIERFELAQVPQIVSTTTRMSWFVYVVRLPNRQIRDATMKALAERGIPSRPYFTPIHLQPFYRVRFGYEPGDFPVTEELGDTSLALPFSSTMTEEQVDFVCRAFVDVVSIVRNL
jgi:perosamine synthetase